MIATSIKPPPHIWMTSDQFIQWREALNLSKTEASAAIGICPNTLRAYESGRHLIPRYIALACEAVSSKRNIDRAVA